MVPQFLKNPLEDLVKNHVQHAEPERIYQIRNLMMNERFFQGKHYAVPKLNGDMWQWTDLRGAMRPDQQQPYDYVLNYYRALGLQLAGLLGKSPNAWCEPDERNDVNSRRARKAGQILKNLWSQWDTETVMAELAMSLWKNGTTFGYTPFVQDSRRFGRTKVPSKVETRQIQISEPEFRCFNCGTSTPESAMTLTCPNPQCGKPFTPEEFFPAETMEVPEVVDYTEFDNGTVEFHLCSAYTVMTPFWIKSLNQAPWLQYEYEEHTGRLLRTFPELREDHLKGILHRYPTGRGGSEDAAMTARQRAQSPYSGDGSHRNMERFTRIWLEPDMYEMFDGIFAKTRDHLYMNYPEGARLSLVNGTLLHIYQESHREVWAACKPSVSEYLYAQPLGDAARDQNRLVNNAFNIMVQTAERGIPIQLFDTRLMNPEALKKNPATVMDWMGVIPPAGGRLSDALWKSDASQLSPSVVQMGTMGLSSMRETTNITPNLIGQSGPKEQTLGQVEIERNQAMLPHNSTWDFMREFKGNCYTNAIRQYAKHSPGDLFFASRASQMVKKLQVEEVSEILEGGWHTEVDSNIPLTSGQKRAQNWRLLELGGEILGPLGVFSPSNRPAIYDTLGNADLKDPTLNGREKALEIIAELVEQEPILMPSLDPMMPPELMPSIPVDEFEDDHLLMATVVKEWTQDATGRLHRRTNSQLALGRPGGYENVLAWGKGHLKIHNLTMAPPPTEAGGGAPPKKGTAPPADEGLESAPPGAPRLEPAGAPTPAPEEMRGMSLEGV